MSTRNPTTLMSISNDDSFDFLFKIVLIGDCGTGKTCVVQRFKTGNYIERHGNTIGVDFSMKTINIDGKKVKVIKSIMIDAWPLLVKCYVNMAVGMYTQMQSSSTLRIRIG